MVTPISHPIICHKTEKSQNLGTARTKEVAIFHLHYTMSGLKTTCDTKCLQDIFSPNNQRSEFILCRRQCNLRSFACNVRIFRIFATKILNLHYKTIKPTRTFAHTFAIFQKKKFAKLLLFAELLKQNTTTKHKNFELACFYTPTRNCKTCCTKNRTPNLKKKDNTTLTRHKPPHTTCTYLSKGAGAACRAGAASLLLFM